MQPRNLSRANLQVMHTLRQYEVRLRYSRRFPYVVVRRLFRGLLLLCAAAVGIVLIFLALQVI